MLENERPVSLAMKVRFSSADAKDIRASAMLNLLKILSRSSCDMNARYSGAWIRLQVSFYLHGGQH
jgi:hypothetical protein